MDRVQPERNGKFKLFRKSSDRSGAEEELLNDDEFVVPSGPVARWKIHPVHSAGRPWGHSGYLGVASKGRPQAFFGHCVGTEYIRCVRGPFSDGRWLTYMSNESGSVRRFMSLPSKAGRGKWQVSANGGFFPRPGATTARNSSTSPWKPILRRAGERGRQTRCNSVLHNLSSATGQCQCLFTRSAPTARRFSSTAYRKRSEIP